ncbi:zinc-binding dehydrogenase [Rhizobium sp. RCC_161_2]|uniref:zinc-binding dehydrogenase n=1 Tax=Rhizobium sp. RCC_161_2 TaxID=3239219 RepID=UPI0035232067
MTLSRCLKCGCLRPTPRFQADRTLTASHAAMAWPGVDHVLEVVGGPHLAKALAAVAPGGRISMIGVLEGNQLSLSVGPLLLKGPLIQGIAVGHHRAQNDLVKAVDALGLKPIIDARYGLSDLPQALEHLNRGAFGKIVIDLSL